MQSLHLYQIKRKTIQLSLDLLIGLPSLQRSLYCGQFLNLTNWLNFKTCLFNFLSSALLKLEFGVNWVHNYWVWIYINTSSLFTCWQRKQIWLISLLPLPHKGYSCVAMAYVVTDLWKNCLQSINRLSRCFFFFIIIFGLFIAFVNELICKTIHSGGKLSHAKRNVPLWGIFCTFTHLYSIEICVCWTRFDLMTFCEYIRMYSNTSNEFVHNILMNLTDCRHTNRHLSSLWQRGCC